MTLLFSPSQEQLEKIAQQDPELFSELTYKVKQEFESQAIKYAKSRLESQYDSAFRDAFKAVEKKFFVKKDGYSSSVKFTPELEKMLSQQIEEKLLVQINKELEEYLESDNFKASVRSRIRTNLLSALTKQLDADIQVEADKFIKTI